MFDIVFVSSNTKPPYTLPIGNASAPVISNVANNVFSTNIWRHSFCETQKIWSLLPRTSKCSIV